MIRASYILLILLALAVILSGQISPPVVVLPGSPPGGVGAACIVPVPLYANLTTGILASCVSSVWTAFSTGSFTYPGAGVAVSTGSGWGTSLSSSMTVNSQTCTLGSSCAIPLSAMNPQTSTYQVLSNDFNNYKTITVASGTFTITLVDGGTQPSNGKYINIVNYGSGVVTIAPSGQNLNGGSSSLTLAASSALLPSSATIWSNGTDYFARTSVTNGLALTANPLSQFASTTSAQLLATLSNPTGSGLAVFGTSPTITTPVITSIVPGANFTISQNSVAPFTSVNSGAVANTLYLNAGTIGVNTALALTKFNVVETSSSSPRGILSSQYSTDTSGARVGFSKARGTEATPTTVVTADTLGRLMFRGYDGSNFLEMGSIEISATGTIAATRVPTFMAFSTATDATPSVLTEALRIFPSGGVAIGSTTDPGALNLKVAGSVYAGNGTNAAPSYSFSSATSWGMYKASASSISIAISGNDTHTFWSDGSFYLLRTAPELKLPSGGWLDWNSDTGFSRISAGVIGIGTGTAGSTAGTIQASLFKGGDAAPAISACGTGPTNPAANSTTGGTITEGTIATGCTITFVSTPSRCVVMSEAGLVFTYALSANVLTVTNIGALSSTALDYMCTK